MVDGSRLSESLGQLAKKCKDAKKSNFLMLIRQSPTFQRASKKRAGSVSRIARSSKRPIVDPVLDQDEFDEAAERFLSPDLDRDATKSPISIDFKNKKFEVPSSWTRRSSSSQLLSSDEKQTGPRLPFADMPPMSAAWLAEVEKHRQNAAHADAAAPVAAEASPLPADADAAAAVAAEPPVARYIDAFDHFTGKGKRIHSDGEVEYANAVAGADSFLQCTFKNGDVMHTQIPALAFERALESAAAVPKRQSKAKANPKSKAKAKAKAKAKVLPAPKAQAKAKGKSKASAKAKVAPKARAKAAAAMAPADVAAAAAVGNGRTNAFYGKLVIIKAKEQSYVQYNCEQQDGTVKKKLVVAVSKSQSADHGDVIAQMASWINQHDRQFTPDELKAKRASVIESIAAFE
jgi:hypothetical protein